MLTLFFRRSRSLFSFPHKHKHTSSRARLRALLIQRAASRSSFPAASFGPGFHTLFFHILLCRKRHEIISGNNPSSWFAPAALPCPHASRFKLEWRTYWCYAGGALLHLTACNQLLYNRCFQLNLTFGGVGGFTCGEQRFIASTWPDGWKSRIQETLLMSVVFLVVLVHLQSAANGLKYAVKGFPYPCSNSITQG